MNVPLQQTISSGNNDMSNFQFFIKNIKDGLQKIEGIETNGSSTDGGNSGSGNSVTNADIAAMQNLITKIQNIFNSGSLQGASGVLQSLVDLLSGLTVKVKSQNAQQILSSIISNMKNLQVQSSSANVDMSSFANLLMQSVNQINQFIMALNSSSAGGSSSGRTEWTTSVQYA